MNGGNDMKYLQGHEQETASHPGAVFCGHTWPVMSTLCLQEYLIACTADVQVTLVKTHGQYQTYTQDLVEIIPALVTLIVIAVFS